MALGDSVIVNKDLLVRQRYSYTINLVRDHLTTIKITTSLILLIFISLDLV